MSKDCNTILGYAYEFNRMCRENDCGHCSFIKFDGCCDDVSVVDEARVKAVQLWADTHPEEIKLTQKEYDFVHSLVSDDADIVRYDDGRLFLRCRDNIFRLDPDMFDFLKPLEHSVMTVKELKNCKLEKWEMSYE